MTNSPAPADRRAALLAIGAISLFSAKPIFIKWIYSYGIDAGALMLLRLAIAAPLFLGVGLWTMRRRHATVRDLMLACALGFLGSYVAGLLDMMGLMYIPAQLERMLLFTYPIFTVLLSWLIYRRRPTPGIYLCMALTYTGLAFMFVTDLSALGTEVIRGTCLVLISSLTFALYMVLSQGPIQRLGSMPFTAVVMLSSTLFMALHQQLWSPEQLTLTSLASYPRPVYGLTALLAIFCTFIPAFMGSEAVRRIGPERVSLLGNTGPVITTLLAIVLLDEAFTAWHGIGMGLVMCGVWLLQRRSRS
jgi:drug/metabolite transporter (DMT)-like permease